MKKIILLTLVIVMIPVLIIGFKDQNILSKIKYGIYSNQTVKVLITDSNEILKIPLEEYVIGVVAGEVPASFNIEALKAQAVAARTYVLKKKELKKNYDVRDTSLDQVYINKEKMKNKWKKEYDKNYKKIKTAVLETKGEVLLYNNNIIDAVFFSTSNGYTENSEDVFQNSTPYLKSVESIWDQKESPAFYSKNIFSKKEFLYNLNLDLNSEIFITNIEKTKTGRVKNLYINNKKYEASKIKKIFNLKSTSFEISFNNDNVIFDVKGFGHGVGLSQYGANGMAKEGYNYKNILLYYYNSCKIKKIN